MTQKNKEQKFGAVDPVQQNPMSAANQGCGCGGCGCGRSDSPETADVTDVRS